RPSLDLAESAVTFIALLAMAALVLVQVFRPGPMTVHRVQGSVAVYMLLGVAWAAAYEVVFKLRPDAFRFPDAHGDRLMLIYYSFVTLTTVGYGDITPVLPVARSLAMVEALVGQLFPAILIARLVSLELAARVERGKNR